MRLHLTYALIAVVFCSPASAGIREVRDLSTDDQRVVFIGFDRAPAIRDAEIAGRELLIYLDAPTGMVQSIEPVRTDTISRVTAEMTEMGYQVSVELPVPANDFDVSATETGIILRWQAGETIVLAQPGPAVIEPAVSPDVEGTGSRDLAPPPTTASTVSTAADLSGDESCSNAALAIESDPWNIDALTIHGQCLIEAENAAQAIVHLERVVAFEPGRFSAVMALGEAREHLGETSAAIALYEQAAGIAATDGEAVAARARARRLQN